MDVTLAAALAAALAATLAVGGVPAFVLMLAGAAHDAKQTSPPAGLRVATEAGLVQGQRATPA